jgi:hypothetical protein
MKKSAVEFLAKCIDLNTKSLVFEQAKELEKEQLRKCYHFAQIEQQKEFSSIYVGMSFEKWYNEIYKNE